MFTKQILHASATMLAAAFMLGCICANGQDVPPPPKPSDDGPSVADTMKFIEEKVGSIGRVNYISYTHDSITGRDATNKYSVELTNPRANATVCRIDYHWRTTMNEQVLQEKDAWFSLKAVQEVLVKTMEQDAKECRAKTGHPEWTDRVDPPVFVLAIKIKDSDIVFSDLYDESLTNRIAKALVHAVELCGGGSKEPF